MLDSDPLPCFVSEEYMLTKCLTKNNVMWSVAIVVRYERWVSDILYGWYTHSITLFKTSSCWYIFWFCYQIDINMEVWSPADNMFQNCCLNQLFLLLSEKRSSVCSISFQKRMAVYSLWKNSSCTQPCDYLSLHQQFFNRHSRYNSNFVYIRLMHRQFLPFCFISLKIQRLSTLIKQKKLTEHAPREILSGKKRHACVYMLVLTTVKLNVYNKKFL